MQSRLGYNSDLRETCISMCRLPLMDDELDSNISYLNRSNVMMYENYVKSTFDSLNQANVTPFNGKTDCDKLVIDGWDWLLKHLSNTLKDDLYLGSKVTDVILDEGGLKGGEVKNVGGVEDNVNSINGNYSTLKFNENVNHPIIVRVVDSEHQQMEHRIVRAKYVIVTVPSVLISSLDSLKSRKMREKNKINFIPPLDKYKCKAINRYKMGHHNKVLLRFDPRQVFWPKNELQFNCLDNSFQFMNLHSYGKEGCILAHSFPPFSIRWSGIDKDEIIVKTCLDLLQKMFSIPSDKMPYPIDSIVTRWFSDPYSGGSYSYPDVDAVEDDIIHLKSPHPKKNPRILFAGEYLSNSYYQCVDGAFDTGIRAAEDIAHLGLNKPYPFEIDPDTPSLEGLLNPMYSDKYLNLSVPIPDIQHLGYYLTDGSDEILTDTRFSNIIPYGLEDSTLEDGTTAIKNELDILENVQDILSKDFVSIKSLERSIDDLKAQFDKLKHENRYNKHLYTAQILVEAFWKSCNEYKLDVKSDEFNVRNQHFSNRVCKNALDSIGIKHEIVCWSCLRGGEVIICDYKDCNKVWHLECLPRKNKKQLNANEWICPTCSGHQVKRGENAADEAIQFYWHRRGNWWRVKALISLCRRVYKRIKYCRDKLENLE